MLLEQLDSCKLDITAIQELRWLDKGVMEKRDHVIFYSCQKKSHTFGTGFIVSKKIKHLILDFQAKSHKICRLRITGKFFNFSLLRAHFPTEDKADEKKDSFYGELDEIYGECLKRDCKIIIGDMNAKVGKEQIYRPVIGKHSLHKRSNDNGMRLINFASSWK
jgi:exonuclease III